MRKFILFAALCISVQGCVGVVVPKTRTKIINDPAVCAYRGVPDEVLTHDSREAGGAFTTNCTPEWLRTKWGAPDHISHDKANQDEVWMYKGDFAWVGVVPFVIVPIPLMLPLTREKVRFSVHDGHVVSARVTKSVTVGGTYGFIPNPEGGGSFGVWNWDDDSPN